MCDRGREFQCKERLVRKSISIGGVWRDRLCCFSQVPSLLALNTHTGAGGAMLTALAEDTGLVPSIHMVPQNHL